MTASGLPRGAARKIVTEVTEDQRSVRCVWSILALHNRVLLSPPFASHCGALSCLEARRGHLTLSSSFFLLNFLHKPTPCLEPGAEKTF